jgi:polyvinyl alcohol dehydrogenase (cytochrome)
MKAKQRHSFTWLTMRSAPLWVLGACCLAALSAATQQTSSGPVNDEIKHAQGTNPGIYAFSDRCSNCHDNGVNGAPDRYALNNYTPEQVLASISTGSMSSYATGLSQIQKGVLAVYVGGRPFGSFEEGNPSGMADGCKPGSAWRRASDQTWPLWGRDTANTRFQTSPGLSVEQIPNLKLKWAFAFPNGNSAYSEPSVVDGRVFVGSDTGWVYAIDAKSGCTYWGFRANAGVRTAILISPPIHGSRLAFFGDIRGNVYALDALKGKLKWRVRPDTHPIARITGSPVLLNQTLYVPVSSLEESAAGNPNYPCCTFRGSLVAYNASSGKLLWRAFTIEQPASQRGVTSKGTKLYGPAGASIWSAPTPDVKRNAVYVATGNGYTQPAADTSDAVMAFDMKTGRRLWANQVRANDGYVRDCPGKYRPNVPTANASETCPDPLGPDVDFGNAPILHTFPDGHSEIVVGEKDGNAWALDPDRNGALIWHTLIGAGIDSGGGGLQWGSAADSSNAYFPLTRGGKGYGLAAVALKDGKILWRTEPPLAASAPVSVIPGAVFEGSNVGLLYAFSTDDGHALWHYDTNHSYETVNKVEGKGGSINGGAGPVVAEGMVFVTSGSSDLFGGPLRGNVLLAFGPGQ